MDRSSSEVIKLCVNSLNNANKMKANEIFIPHQRSLISTLRKLDRDKVILNLQENQELFQVLVEVMANGCLTPESETLVSAAFCLLLKCTLDVKELHELLFECLSNNHIITLRIDKSSYFSAEIFDLDLFSVCLSYSILECFDVVSFMNFYDPNIFSCKKSSKPLLQVMFDILETNCMKFSALTHFAFKLLILWLRRLNDLVLMNPNHKLFTVTFLYRTILIVNSNWENPIPGIREKNSQAMKIVFDILPQNEYLVDDFKVLSKFLKTTLQELPWRMKSKYFILISCFSNAGVKKVLLEHSHIADGLVYSLSYSHLVSAGTDLYREILKELSIEDWKSIFLFQVKNLLRGKNRVAKQNFMNYWLSETLKVYPCIMDELLAYVMIDVDSSSSCVLSALTLLKIGRKRGWISDWLKQVDQNLIQECLDQIDEDVREESFAIVCTSPKTTLCPSQNEMVMAYKFLEENINADNSRLRQIMCRSFRTFILRIKDATLAQRAIQSSAVDVEDDKRNQTKFFQRIKRLIVSSCEPGANYQRNVCSLLLLDIIFDEFHESSTSHETVFSEEILGCFKDRDVLSLLLKCLLDSAADVRDIASSILKKHFELPDSDFYSMLWEIAMNRCKSSMFYHLESGAALAEVLVHWKMKMPKAEGDDDIPFLEMLLSHADEQKTLLKENLLRGSKESPVHGILNALYRMISDQTVCRNLKIRESHIDRLLHFIEDLIRFLIGVLSSQVEATSNVAPSFAEMGEAIKDIIWKNIDTLDSIHDKELDEAHDLLLNCIWLNLKMCSLLLSAIATTFNAGEIVNGTVKEKHVEKCARLLMFVLTMCRHKGVIESAGRALLSLSSFCAKNAILREMPVKLLSDCLDEIALRGDKTSVTRRSAGLAILVHKLVAADGKRTIPLCIPKLLSWTKLDQLDEDNIIGKEDLLQTRALHFLKVIVQDPGLYHYVTPYMSEIALTCFQSFSSNIWAIRNATLQLFGAVVSKLVGQKKTQEEDTVGSNVTFEELTAHYPQLMEYLLKELKNSSESTNDKYGSISPNLLPILSLCSRLSLSIPQLHTSTLKNNLFEFRNAFSKLLSSPIIEVRNLCAKALSAFTPMSELPRMIFMLTDSLAECCSGSENELHGKLLCIQIMRDRLEIDSCQMPSYVTIVEEVHKYTKRINSLVSLRNLSFYTRALLCKLQNFSVVDLSCILSKAKNCRWYPGLTLWCAVTLDLLITSCSEDSICEIISHCSKHSNTILEFCLESIQKRDDFDKFSESNRLNISFLLLELCDSHLPSNCMYQCLSLLTKFSDISPVYISITKIESLFANFIQDSSFGIVCSSLAIPLITLLVAKNRVLRKRNDLRIQVAQMIKERSSPDCPEYFRIQSGKALYFCTDAFWEEEDSKETKVELKYLLTASIFLLQDESTEVRKEAAKSVSHLIKSKINSPQKIIFNPQICIKLVFEKILQLLSLETAIEFLWESLQNETAYREMKNSIEVKSIRNPFSNESSNIYAENVRITHLIAESLLTVIRSNSIDSKNISDLVSKRKEAIVEDANTMIHHLSQKELDECHSQLEVYHSIIKVTYQLEVMSALKFEGNEELENIILRLKKLRTTVYKHQNINLFC